MSSPNTRLYTEDEEIAYDSGLMDGAAKERERIVALIRNIRDTWQRPPAHNYQRELTKIVALIEEPASLFPQAEVDRVMQTLDALHHCGFDFDAETPTAKCACGAVANNPYQSIISKGNK